MSVTDTQTNRHLIKTEGVQILHKSNTFSNENVKKEIKFVSQPELIEN